MRPFAALPGALLLAFFAGCGSPQAPSPGHAQWSYAGENGPQNWAKNGFLAKGVGQEQSPIDIPSSTATCGKELGIRYEPSILKVVNNGHTIEADCEKGSGITVDGIHYDLLQFHFHCPSEHTIDGKLLDLELHLVHKNAAGGLAVIGILFKEGKTNPNLDPVFMNMPATEGASVSTSKPVNASSLLPTDRAYYRYDGSLTTPPGTEGVKWHVMSQVCELSKEQLDAFKKLYSGNNRPVQPMNKRSFQ